MSDGETTGNERTSVGVVAPEADASHVVEAVRDAGGDADIGTAAVAAESDAVVAVGDAALSALAASVTAPVLPVGAEDIESAERENVKSTVERFLGGDYRVQEYPLLRVETATADGRALFDVALSTAEPATISEFAVDTAAADSVDEPVARFRADGVVVATPAGSRGYARAAGGPVVVPGSGVAAVVPISPFATDPDHWILPLSALSLTVERDETDVTVVVDGRPLCSVGVGATVRLVRDGELRVAIVA